MKNTLLNQRTINIAVVVSAMLLAAFIANASTQPESLLLSVGFKAKVATTAKQRQELKTLPAGKVSPVTQKGKTFYIYPNLARNEMYVGEEAQYQAYKKLITKPSGSAGPIVNTDHIGGTQVPVREFYGWAPFDQITR